MRRTIVVLVSLAMVVAVIGGVPLSGASMGGDDGNADGDGDGDGDDVKPGEQLSGVVGAQQAEVDGEIEARAFGHQIAQAETDDERAAILADRVNQSEKRLQALEDELDELERERDRGNLTRGQHAAQATAIQAQVNATERQLGQSENVSQGLPEHVLEAHAVDVAAIQELRNNASAMTGPEVSALARSIAGPNVGGPMGAGPPENVTRGPPGDAGPGDRTPGPQNQTDSGDRSASLTDAGDRGQGD